MSTVLRPTAASARASHDEMMVERARNRGFSGS
jgi:hypothetical protein